MRLESRRDRAAAPALQFFCDDLLKHLAIKTQISDEPLAGYPNPGTKGSIMLGFDLDVPVETAVSRLAQQGVPIKGTIVRSNAGNFANVEDPDGNEIYLWEKVKRHTQEPASATSGAA